MNGSSGTDHTPPAPISSIGNEEVHEWEPDLISYSSLQHLFTTHKRDARTVVKIVCIPGLLVVPVLLTPEETVGQDFRDVDQIHVRPWLSNVFLQWRIYSHLCTWTPDLPIVRRLSGKFLQRFSLASVDCLCLQRYTSSSFPSFFDLLALFAQWEPRTSERARFTSPF